MKHPPTSQSTAGVRASARAVMGRALFRIVTLVWQACFALFGKVFRPRAVPIQFSGSERVLVVAPHPDDETIGCGGTIARHARAGASVTVCIVTDGGQSTVPGVPRGDVARLRRIEADQAIGMLGDVTLVQLGLPEGTWNSAIFSTHLSRLLKRAQPTVIYTTSPIDYHPDHIRVAFSLSRCLQEVAPSVTPFLRLYEVQVPLTPILTNRIAGIEDTISQKKRALASYRTQQRSLRWLPRLSQYNRRLFRAPWPAEYFCEITAQQFSDLCHRARTHPSHYFGIRSRPLTDPLAWLIGRRARLQLRKAISKPHN